MENTGKENERKGDLAELISVKESLAVLPIAATVLALLYDIGYFSIVGLQFIPFFSLSEHVVFALEALPVVVIALFAIPIFLNNLAWRGSFDYHEWKLEHFKLSRALHLGASIVGVLAAYLGLSGFGYLLISASIASGFFPRAGRPKVFFFVAIVIGLCWTAFGWGRQAALWAKGYAKESRLVLSDKPDQTIVGAVMRAGDKSVLFYDLREVEMVVYRRDMVRSIMTGNPKVR